MDARVKNRMVLTLPSDREIVIAREFNAPRRRVFEAWTNPEQVRQWYGCDETHLVSCEIDLRVGGEYRYVLLGQDGGEHVMTGHYLEIVAPDRLVYTERYVSEQFESDEAFVTVTFVERDGRTKLTSTVLHKSSANRDMHLNSGVEKGAGLTLDRLEQLLWTMD
jgi:uncharacterized protein YndB with AHSA1/START domain